MKDCKVCPNPECGNPNHPGLLFCALCQADLGDVPFSPFPSSPTQPESELSRETKIPESSIGGYVKICPACNLTNLETAPICAACSFDLLTIEVAPAPQTQPESREKRETPPPGEELSGVIEPHRRHLPPLSLSLICGNGRVITINKATVTVGQFDPERMEKPLADVQLIPTEESPDIRYIHRRHCQLSFSESRWWITPLEQPHLPPEFSRPNPTFIDNNLLDVGCQRELRDNDLLTLGCLSFTIRLRQRSGFSPEIAPPRTESP
jgi:hypothetical protein